MARLNELSKNYSLNALKIAAVGDMAFVGRYENINGPNPLTLLAKTFAQYDLVIGNLECPLTLEGQSVPGKCTLRGNPLWAPKLQQAGVNVLSLANNHLMDYGKDGLLNTIDHLNQSGIQWLGAGRNSEEALAPLVIDANGSKIALVARSSVFVASPSYADLQTPGIARFDLQETTATLKSCRLHADIVILLLHWGIEHYRYPTPSQRKLAKNLISAGADFIIGHHPHVLQGIEYIEGGAVAYSLGNFLFDHFTWRFTNNDGDLQENNMRLTPMQREAGLLTLEKEKGSSFSIGFIPTRIEDNTLVSRDITPHRQMDMPRLSVPFRWPAYGLFWRIYSLEREFRIRILPLVRGKLSWEKFKHIRTRHFLQLFKTLRRSVGITGGRNTNPYE